ncbi:hypothetical protein PLANPX_5301 [Lacipirellula parvula]|uniref:Uncharacterized protein n=1 Tax=Lacipirellula parvula TaxID=2650471 RepID=A0A5K7XQ66_9BACT|nr:hypothetical protein PLANPX_5301 [Lacipirellula parvula]
MMQESMFQTRDVSLAKSQIVCGLAVGVTCIRNKTAVSVE